MTDDKVDNSFLSTESSDLGGCVCRFWASTAFADSNTRTPNATTLEYFIIPSLLRNPTSRQRIPYNTKSNRMGAATLRVYLRSRISLRSCGLLATCCTASMASGCGKLEQVIGAISQDGTHLSI